MLIKDILLRDPSQEALVNNGQARISNEAADANVEKELRGELSTFVCEGQYADGIIKILSSFLASRSQTHQKSAWVDRKSTRLNSSHLGISYAVFCLKKKKIVYVALSAASPQITSISPRLCGDRS